MKKIFIAIGLFLLLSFILLVVISGRNMRDRNPGYKADMKILPGKVSSLKAGFSAVTITPDVPDRWNDSDADAKYDPKKGDTFTDGNGNGIFDPVWIAGFGNGRAANGIHDDLWARTMIIDDGTTRIAIVVLDVIGFMSNNVIDIKKQDPPGMQALIIQ